VVQTIYLAVAVALALLQALTSTVWPGLPLPEYANLLPQICRSNPNAGRQKLKLGWWVSSGLCFDLSHVRARFKEVEAMRFAGASLALHSSPDSESSGSESEFE
jgi:hypothetical protein